MDGCARRSAGGWRAATIGGTALCLAVVLCLAGCGLFVPNAQIDWVNFVQFGGIVYVPPSARVGRALTDDDLGPVYDHVRLMLDGNVKDPNYHAQDGDASYLDAGAPVYAVKGYAATFRLAARFAGRLTLYEADTNPKAKTGADLLDIGGKVVSIGVNSEYDGKTELTSIDDPDRVAALVALVLAAPVDQHRDETSSAAYSIVFHLEDGTAVARGYWPDSGQLGRGIMTPPEFRAAVEQAVRP